MREVIKIAFPASISMSSRARMRLSALGQASQNPPDAVSPTSSCRTRRLLRLHPDFARGARPVHPTPVIYVGVVNKTSRTERSPVRADELIRKPFQPQEPHLSREDIALTKAVRTGKRSAPRAPRSPICLVGTVCARAPAPAYPAAARRICLSSGGVYPAWPRASRTLYAAPSSAGCIGSIRSARQAPRADQAWTCKNFAGKSATRTSLQKLQQNVKSAAIQFKPSNARPHTYGPRPVLTTTLLSSGLKPFHLTLCEKNLNCATSGSRDTIFQPLIRASARGK